MTHKKVEKFFELFSSILNLSAGTTWLIFNLFLCDLFGFSRQSLVYPIIFILVGILGLILTIRNEPDPSLWEDKIVVLRVKLSTIGALLLLLFDKIFVVDEFYNGSPMLLLSTCLLILPISAINLLCCLFHMIVNNSEFNKELINSEKSNLANVNPERIRIRIRVPGRLCAIFCFVLSCVFFFNVVAILSIRYRYPSSLEDILLKIWFNAVALGVSIFLGNRAKNKGYDCCFASSGLSVGTAGLVVVLVLIAMSQC